MTLEFPNRSRSFDEVRDAVRFTGYDGMFEVSFYVESGALSAPRTTLAAHAGAEAAYLSAFDAHRSSILDAARNAYARKRSDRYTLTAGDLR